MRLSDLVKLKEFKPHHDLSQLLGQIQFQLVDGPIDDVQIKCFGAIDESRTLSMAFLKGLLEKRVPERDKLYKSHINNCYFWRKGNTVGW